MKKKFKHKKVKIGGTLHKSGKKSIGSINRIGNDYYLVAATGNFIKLSEKRLQFIKENDGKLHEVLMKKIQDYEKSDIEVDEEPDIEVDEEPDIEVDEKIKKQGIQKILEQTLWFT